MRSLAGKTVLITGAARGIGLCAAREFAGAGCHVVLVDRDRATLAEAEAALRGSAGRIGSFAVDVADERAVAALADQVVASFGAVDVLVNNAGIGHSAELARTSKSTWRSLLDVNFWGPLHLVDAFLPAMRTRRAGHIINVSSGQAFLRMPGWGAYATTKVALAGYSEILHHELRHHGIAVSTIYPFMVRTRFYDQAQPSGASGRVALQLALWMADSPEKVGRRIFEAAATGRARDRVSWINEVGYYAQMVPPLATAMGRTIEWIFRDRAPRPALGFRIDEEMVGHHRLAPGLGSSETRPMSFRITWGPDDLRTWLTPGRDFMRQPLTGRVSVDGLAADVPCRGDLDIDYRHGRIRYTFDFEVDGRAYRYTGEKHNIRPWNLPVSHTTLFGGITEVATGRLVSTSVLHFELRRLPHFLRSFRLTRAQLPASTAAASAGAAAA